MILKRQNQRSLRSICLNATFSTKKTTLANVVKCRRLIVHATKISAFLFVCLFAYTLAFIGFKCYSTHVVLNSVFSASLVVNSLQSRDFPYPPQHKNNVNTGSPLLLRQSDSKIESHKAKSLVLHIIWF